MRNILFIVGLPGSGKTTLANQLLETSHSDYVLIDDWSVNVERRNIDAERIIITDPIACLATPEKIMLALEDVLGPIDDLRFIAFENDPDAAWANCEKREDKPISKFLLYDMSKRYDPLTFSTLQPWEIYRS